MQSVTYFLYCIFLVIVIISFSAYNTHLASSKEAFTSYIMQTVRPRQRRIRKNLEHYGKNAMRNFNKIIR